MLYFWIKTLVGILLAINFFLPLYTVVVNKYLHDEPMAVLAANLSLNGMLFGVLIAAIGAYDVLQLQLYGLCSILQNMSFGIGIAMKFAQIGMAVDQFMAVKHPLHRYQMMERILPWILSVTPLMWVVQTGFGITTSALGMQTPGESLVGRENASRLFPECRYEMGITLAQLLSIEFEALLSSVATASLFVHTGLIGTRNNARLRRRLQRSRITTSMKRSHQRFRDNFKAFKNVCAVLSLTMVLDIAFMSVRTAARWHPLPKLNGFMHNVRLFGFIIEGWAYGLLNAKMRTEYRKILCRRPTAVGPRPGGQEAERKQPVESQPASSLRRQGTLDHMAGHYEKPPETARTPQQTEIGHCSESGRAQVPKSTVFFVSNNTPTT